MVFCLVHGFPSFLVENEFLGLPVVRDVGGDEAGTRKSWWCRHVVVYGPQLGVVHLETEALHDGSNGAVPSWQRKTSAHKAMWNSVGRRAISPAPTCNLTLHWEVEFATTTDNNCCFTNRMRADQRQRQSLARLVWRSRSPPTSRLVKPRAPRASLHHRPSPRPPPLLSGPGSGRPALGPLAQSSNEFGCKRQFCVPRGTADRRHSLPRRCVSSSWHGSYRRNAGVGLKKKVGNMVFSAVALRLVSTGAPAWMSRSN